MKSIWWAVVLISVASVAIAEDAADEKATELEGTWKVAAMEIDGEQASPEVLKEMEFTFSGDELIYKDRNGLLIKATFELDSAKSPKEIDWNASEGRQKGKSVSGIYQLENDELKICMRNFPSKEKGRPKEFKTEPESGLGVLVMKKVEKE